MTIELGIELDVTQLPIDTTTALAQRAEAGGLDLVVLTGADTGPDPWTTAVWVAGRTARIQVGVTQE
ncbi:MAG: LLM class flavin-dependent oxidoreductase, partial [Aldersonia sp.]|nr:LLM class flavin-dependent oxidoreductase [Aldersonia sp.]